MSSSYRIWIGFLSIAIVILSACSDIPQTLESTPTQIAPIEVTPTEAILWPTEGWQYSTPAEQGLDSVVLEQMSSHILENVPGARSILVVREGYLVYEDYLIGDEIYAGPIWSVTKSFLSALIGIALEEGYLGDIDDKLMDYLAEYASDDTDPYFDEINLRHLLTMTAGFSSYQGGTTNIPDAFLEDLVNKPGEEANYSSTSTHLLSALLQEASGVTALKLANERIFTPLGITGVRWDDDVDGINLGGSGLYLTPRDMAKFGYLYLNDGQWAGQQIIPREWVESSTKKQAEAGIPELSGFADYGYLWWLHPLGDYKAFVAFGAGGQMLLVVPEVELVVVSTTDTTDSMEMVSVVEQFMISAIMDE